MKWWQIRERNADLERELRSDVELEEEEQRENGLSPEEARYAARRAFGNSTLIREQTHEAWGWVALERLGQDIRYGVRQLLRSPAFTVTAVLILALGIGAVTAVFSLIDTALLRMLPVEKPEQLVEFKAANPALPPNDTFSYPTFKLSIVKRRFWPVRSLFANCSKLMSRWTDGADWRKDSWFRAITSLCWEWERPRVARFCRSMNPWRDKRR